MRQPKLSRVCSCLSLVALAGLTIPACATKSNDEAAKGKDAKAQDSEPSGEEAKQDEAGQPIAGKPVEGEGKVGEAAGDGGANEQYALQIDPGEGKVGEEGKVSIKVVPNETWHMNLDYPTKLEVAPPTGVEVAKTKQTKDDAVTLTEESAEFAVAFTPSEAGEKTFTGEFKFAVCQDTACVPKTEKLEFKVAVK
jgi:hypothetical protein